MAMLRHRGTLPWLAMLVLVGCAEAPGLAGTETVTQTDSVPPRPLTPEEMRDARALPMPGAQGGPALPDPAPSAGRPGQSPGAAGEPTGP